MGLTVVKENFFLVACSSSAFAISHSLVLSFMNTLNLIQAPSIQLSSRQTYWNICLHLKRSLQHMHKLRQKLKLPWLCLGLSPAWHHPSFPSTPAEQLICQNITYQNPTTAEQSCLGILFRSALEMENTADPVNDMLPYSDCKASSPSVLNSPAHLIKALSLEALSTPIASLQGSPNHIPTTRVFQTVPTPHFPQK